MNRSRRRLEGGFQVIRKVVIIHVSQQHVAVRDAALLSCHLNVHCDEVITIMIVGVLHWFRFIKKNKQTFKTPEVSAHRTQFGKTTGI